MYILFLILSWPSSRTPLCRLEEIDDEHMWDDEFHQAAREEVAGAEGQARYSRCAGRALQGGQVRWARFAGGAGGQVHCAQVQLRS